MTPQEVLAETLAEDGLDGVARLLVVARARAWEEGRCAAARGVKNNPYIDTASKNEEA